jgi:nicotinate-nucleotide adenylyltransferase
VSNLNKRLSFITGRRPRVGLLGGSFNPAHAGHIHISRLALELLDLDEIWWLVSPQNPLRETEGMAPLTERLDGAAALAKNLKIWVTNIESKLGTLYTIDTLTALKNYFPRARFVWIIGADNLSQISRWKNWMAIFKSVPVAVFARPEFTSKALTSTAAKRFSKRRINQSKATDLIIQSPPAWTFLSIPLSDISATKIRDESSNDSKNIALKKGE